MIRNKQVREQKDGVTKFVTFDMVDKDIAVDAKIFGVTDRTLEMLEDGKTYNAAVDVKTYAKSKTGYSCIIYNIEPQDVPATAFADWQDNLEEQGRIINDALQNISETYYGKIAYPILVRYWSKFSQWSAASGQHHTQLGGLLTHTAEVVDQSILLANYFNDKYGDTFINKPLLIAAAMLHDVGKCNELEVDVQSGTTKYSTYATLQTHIMDILEEVAIEAYRQKIGYQTYETDSDTGEQVEQKDQDQLAEEIEAVKLLEHLLGQHHGKLEWGSPITPNTPEAYILNQMDEMSATMFKFNREFKSMEAGTASTKWNSGVTQVYKDQTKWDQFDDLD